MSASPLPHWSNRSPEEADLFNPAFCGVLVSEFVRAAYISHRKKGVAAPLIFCALPIALHSDTRVRLPERTVTSPFTWLERNPEVVVGFHRRAVGLVPYVREAVIFATARKAVEVDQAGEFVPGGKKTIFTDGFLTDGTSETRDIAFATRFLGRWFAGASDPATLLAGWGITV